MDRTVTSCDVCSADRREANHWFKYARLGATIYIGRHGDPPFTLATRAAALLPEEKHACGETCLLKAVSMLLQEIAKLT